MIFFNPGSSISIWLWCRSCCCWWFVCACRVL